MIGPLTYFGWMSLFASIALWVAMFRGGRHSLWKLGALLTAPFLLFLGFVEFNTSGPNMFVDPYGRMILIMVLTPFLIGWTLFVAGYLSRKNQPIS